jgi:hypothetical protein
MTNGDFAFLCAMRKLRKIGLIGFAAVTVITIVLGIATGWAHKVSLPFLMPFAVMLLIDLTRKKN